MDYRTLLRCHPGMLAVAGAGGGQADGCDAHDDDGGVQRNGFGPSSSRCAGDEPCAACGGAVARGASQRGGGQAPPPKRGRYITAGPPDPGPPSLQYCTPLHLAALYGHLEVVAALLATGRVSRQLSALFAQAAAACHARLDG
jgi:hypothetical protein